MFTWKSFNNLKELLVTARMFLNFSRNSLISPKEVLIFSRTLEDVLIIDLLQYILKLREDIMNSLIPFGVFLDVFGLLEEYVEFILG